LILDIAVMFGFEVVFLIPFALQLRAVIAFVMLHHVVAGAERHLFISLDVIVGQLHKPNNLISLT
jgi:hypothetical protein